MRFRTSISFGRRAAIVVLLVVGGSALIASGAPADDTFKTAELAWRADYEKDLRQPDGWLTLVGLAWLKPGDNSVGGAADNSIVLKAPAAAHMGVVRMTGDKLELAAPGGGFPQGLEVDGKVPAGGQALYPDTSEHASRLTLGTLSITIIQRGDRHGLRIKNSAAPLRTNFPGLKWYAPNPAYRVKARWLPYNPPKQEKIPTVLGTEIESTVPGAAEFTLDGQTFRLEPMVSSPTDMTLFFVMRDTTAKTTTDGAGRFLYVDAPKSGLSQPAELWLDFNQAHNPPCAYTPYATCPLPPLQNRLKVAIPAGEQRFPE